MKTASLYQGREKYRQKALKRKARCVNSEPHFCEVVRATALITQHNYIFDSSRLKN
jgi:hypothetical protein